ncbi:MAG: ABC transporter ATP-binding protein/permease [Flavobacteriales bacterium]|nr:ABC transporter ATP-binding protein/permease [Flavobacteriales bacterium]MDW8409322.1 ABC transporter ATP-binding protein [Flavobacteriales bacterium]
MMSRLNAYLRPHASLFILGVCFVVLANIFSLYPARLISRSLDLVITQLELYSLLKRTTLASAISEPAFEAILVFAAAILILALVKGFFMFLMRQTLIIISRKIEYKIKNQLYAHYQTLDQYFFKMHSTGDLMTRISEDVSRVRMYLGPAIMYTINMVVMCVLVVAMMLTVSPRLTAVVLFPMPILALVVYGVNHTLLQRSDVQQSRLALLSSYVQESLAGIRIVKFFHREYAFAMRLENVSLQYRDASLRLARVDAALFPTVLLLIGVSTVLTLVFGAKEIAQGRITHGVIAEFIVYINMLTWPVASLGWVTSITQQALVSFRRICEYLDSRPHVISGPKPVPSQFEEIRFEKVSFSYPETGIRALHQVSFTLRRGTCLCITGPTGSGKSALVALLLRFYDPEEGQIFLNGEDIRTLDLAQYRQMFSYVPQDAGIFSDTIAANINWGRDEVLPLKVLEEAAQQACVLDSIKSLPEGFNTLTGEKGVKLSGGQKQRIALARAFLKPAPVLVLDDCLSALDYGTEAHIRKYLQSLLPERTLLITGHRVSAFPPGCRVLVLQHGRIAEEGTPEELLAKDGYFAAIYREQRKPQTDSYVY